MKKLFTLLFLTSLVFISCSKKDDEVVCFDDIYNGTYSGTVIINQVRSPASIKLTKKGCNEAQIESAADIGDKNINSIISNGQGGYIGKLALDGSAISMVLTGNTINIVANSKYSFIGTK